MTGAIVIAVIRVTPFTVLVTENVAMTLAFKLKGGCHPICYFIFTFSINVYFPVTLMKEGKQRKKTEAAVVYRKRQLSKQRINLL